MRDDSLLIGIDGGGSKTLVLLANAQLQILGRGIGGPSNYLSIGLPAALDALETAAAAAFAQAGLNPHAPVAALALGMAGVDRPADKALFTTWAGQRFPGAQLYLANDAHLVLAAGTPAGWGLAVISGTGSIVYGRDIDGNTARTGGWGYLLGDEGSGYRIGISGLQAVARAWDGLEPPTLLTEQILAHLRLNSPAELVGYVYHPATTRAEIARLAPLVEATAHSGDAAAQQIMDQAAVDLANFAAAAAKKLDLRSPVPCALAGGMLVHSPDLRAHFRECAQIAGLHLDPFTPVREPALGALRLAANLLK
jgi:N-acetylmuramic acid 6-phosphate etherase